MNALKQGKQAMLNGNEIVRHGRIPARTRVRSHQRLCAATAAGFHPEEEQPAQRRAWSSNRCPSSCNLRAASGLPLPRRRRTLLTQVAHAYGITAQFDDSVQQRRVHFDIQDVNFATAMEAATAVTKTFWVPLSARQVLVLADTVENHRNFERMGLRTFSCLSCRSRRLRK